jgi:DNA-directed RNA polymerase specialized sigma24 family protein
VGGPVAAVMNNRLNPVSSFRDLAREQLPRLLSLARRLVGEDAEDVVQDCLLKAYRRFDQLHDAAADPAWLTSILVNCCRDREGGSQGQRGAEDAGPQLGQDDARHLHQRDVAER